MLALITLSTIRARAVWLFGDSDSVDVTSSAGKIKDFLFVSAISTVASPSVNQEHALSLDAVQTFKIG